MKTFGVFSFPGIVDHLGGLGSPEIFPAVHLLVAFLLLRLLE